jgi:arginase family enzyme
VRINDFFEPVSAPALSSCFMPQEDSLLNQIVYGFEGVEEYDLAAFDVAIVGIADDINALNNKGCSQGVHVLRPMLAALRKTSRSLKIIDLGNIRGKTLNDRYFAIREVCKILLEYQVKGIFLGAGQDYTLPVVRSLTDNKGDVVVSVIDPRLDLLHGDADYSSQSFLTQLKLELGASVFDLNVLGVQKYLVGESQEREMDALGWEYVRLRDLRNEHINHAEPYLRDAEVVSFDVGAIARSYMPYHAPMNSNGFNGYEACQMAWYAGMSDHLRFFGLHEYNPQYDTNSIGGGLCAQMIWHVLEGMALKTNDVPSVESENYKIFVVHLHNFSEDIRFYTNRVNHRWWIEVPWKDSVRLISCSENEYMQTRDGSMPEKWWRFFQKGYLK